MKTHSDWILFRRHYFFFPLFFVLNLTCSVGVWFQDEILTSSVKNPRPVPPFTVPENIPGKKYLQFLALGDAGTGRDGQKSVAASMADVASRDSVSFVLMLGDNFYPSGVTSSTDVQWHEKFETMYSYAGLQVPFYAVLGNHDYYSNPDAEVAYSGISKRWKMPSRYYAFFYFLDDTARVDFFCLDTTPLDTEKTEEREEGKSVDSVDYRIQISWLENRLQESRARWKIVVGHHALYSGGVHGDNKGLIAMLEPLFQKHSVDLYVAGHDHHLEMKRPIKGIHYLVSGGGGTHRSVTWMDNALYAGTNMGFNRFRLSTDELVIEFFDKDGVRKYAYTISKGSRMRD